MNMNISGRYETNAYYGGANRKSSTETPSFSGSTAGKGSIVYMMTDDMLYSGGNGTGLSYYIKYAEDSTEENPIVVAKGIDENGKEFEQRIAIRNINPANATIVEMHALENHYKADKGGGISSLPLSAGGEKGLNDRHNFLDIFEKVISDCNMCGRYDLVLFYSKNLEFFKSLRNSR